MYKKSNNRLLIRGRLWEDSVGIIKIMVVSITIVMAITTTTMAKLNSKAVNNSFYHNNNNNKAL